MVIIEMSIIDAPTFKNCLYSTVLHTELIILEIFRFRVLGTNLIYS